MNQELLLAAKLSRRYVMQGLPVHATTHYLVSNMHHPLQLGGKLAARTVSKGPWNGRSRDGDVTVKVNIAGDASLRSCWQRAVGTQLRSSSCSGSDISGYVWLGIACLMQPSKEGARPCRPSLSLQQPICWWSPGQAWQHVQFFLIGACMGRARTVLRLVSERKGKRG